MGYGTIILIGGSMTLEDGSVIDTRQKIEDLKSTDAMRKAMVTSLMWWQAVQSVVLPLLRSSEQAEPAALLLGPRSVMTLKADGSAKRTRLKGLLDGGVGSVQLFRTGIGNPPLPDGFTQVADLRTYAEEGMGLVGYKLDGDAVNWRFVDGSSYYLNHVGPALRPPVFVDAEQNGEDTQFSSSPNHLDEHRLFRDATTLVVAHTNATERLARRYCKWIEKGCPPAPQPRGGLDQSWDPDTIDPGKYVLPVPIAAEFRVSGLVRDGVWTDPGALEAARQLLEARYDLQLGMWDLVDNPTLRQALLAEVRATPKPRAAAILPKATKARAEASADATKARREAAKLADQQVAARLKPLTKVGWRKSRYDSSYSLGIGAKAKRPYSEEAASELVWLDLRVSKTVWRLGVQTSIYNDVNISAFAKPLTDQLNNDKPSDPTKKELPNYVEVASGQPGWDRPDEAWAPFLEEIAQITPRLVGFFEPFAVECNTLVAKQRRDQESRGGQPLATITIDLSSGRPEVRRNEPPPAKQQKGLLGRLFNRD